MLLKIKILFILNCLLLLGCKQIPSTNYLGNADKKPIENSPTDYFLVNEEMQPNKFRDSAANLHRFVKGIENFHLSEKKTVNEIPQFIKSFIGIDEVGGFSMANPGENWQVGCVNLIIIDENGQIISESLPKTQLAYFGIGSNFAMLAYYVGGAGRSTHVVGMKFSGEQISDFYSFDTPHALNTPSEILNYLF